MAQVLIIDDNPDTLGTLKELVLSLGHEARTAPSGEEGIERARERVPELILLDWEMTGISGPEVCRRLRADSAFKQVPIIMVTARADVESRIEGLEAGADDYLGKPFQREELSARVCLSLRKPVLLGGSDQLLELGNVRLNPRSMEVAVGEHTIHLTSREFEILQFFMRHPDRVYDRKVILKEIWPETVVGARTVDTHITHLRKKMAGATHAIGTVHGQGFILRPADSD
ncbi:MAG: response regulator transcription factor [Bdellovibrionales bacterium]|nr:response regulator transcription factor [Bdellovibrionales bacterium]